MDTELYIIGKDVAELKISKKFRFEKISSDFKMSILLYGKIHTVQNVSVSEMVLRNFHFRSISGRNSKSFPEKTVKVLNLE